jgi:hypothetical protein
VKTLNLTIWERVQLTTLMAQQRGNPQQYRKSIRVLDVVELNEEEQEAVGYEATVTNGRLDFNWKHERDFELSFEDADYKTLTMAVTSFDGWPTDRRVGALLDKLGIGE